MNNKSLCYLLTVLLLALAIPAGAHDNETLFNVVNLQARAEREIPNDQMIAILATEHQGSNAAAVGKEINQDMQWALEIIKTYKEVDSKTGSYRTYPIYNKQAITGWRGSQQVEVKSENMTSLTELVGKLQERLQVKQMTFSPTDTAREQHENELIEEAMIAFQERVAIVGKHMAQKNHRIVQININSAGYQPPMPFERATMLSTKEAAPAVEAGTSKITVTVNGSVQFF